MDIHIKQDEIAKYVWTRLLVLGYVPTSDEILDLSEIIICYLAQFLLDYEIINDVEFLDEEEDK